MVRFGNPSEMALALMGLGLMVNVAVAVAAFAYVLLFVTWSVVGLFLGLLFGILGTMIVVGYLQIYASRGLPT